MDIYEKTACFYESVKTEKRVIGKSLFGRNIYAVKVGGGSPVGIAQYSLHGREFITAELAFLHFEVGVSCGSVWLVPLANPDGCEISLKGESACGENSGWFKRLCGGDFAHWNANFRGVDINHNFDAGWEELHNLERESGYFGPGPTRYGGPCPHSEPETKALVEYCETHNVCYVIAFHSQGELIYWDYKNIPTHRGRKMAEIFSASTGYALDIPTGLSAGGGFKDWFIERFHRPGFTVEMGLGKNPLPAESGEKIYETLEEMMMIGLLM